MAKLPDKFSTGHPVVIDAVNGHPVRPVDVNGIALDDATQQYSIAHPVIETDANGVVLLDSTRVFSMTRKVKIDPNGIPVITIDATGTALGTSLGIGGGVVTAATYDSTWGTDLVTSAATGWHTFDLKAGCRRIWCNSIEGIDTNDGLTPATAVKTLAKACQIANAGYTAGDQLMFAGTGSRTYTDDGIQTVIPASGFSKIYPRAVLSYDPADATNAAKYGKLLGPDKPRVTAAYDSAPSGQSSFSTNPSVLINHYFVQGFEFDGHFALLGGTGPDGFTSGIATVHAQTQNIGFQNCQFYQTGITFQPDSTVNNTNGNWGTGFHCSKSSFTGQWRVNGNNSGIFMEGCTAAVIEDNVFVHCGYKLGADRNDDLTAGGSLYLGHGMYWGAINGTATVRRNVGIECAQDAFSFRGSVNFVDNVSIDCPVAMTPGGFSGSYSENPSGSTVIVRDFSAIGCDWYGDVGVRSQSHGGGAFGTQNTVNSIMDNVALLNSPDKGINGEDIVWTARNDNPGIAITWAINRVHAYNYATQWQSALNGTQAGTTVLTYTNCIGDVAGFTGVSTWGGAPAGYKTNSQIYTAMGFSSRNSMLNTMYEYPHLKWAQSLNTIILPCVSLALEQDPTSTPPSLTGLTAPRSLYPTTSPVLSSPTSSSVGSSTATVGVTTDTATGGIRWVISTSNTPPSAVQFRFGQEASGATAPASGFISVGGSAGAKTASVTGLATSTTYYAHFLHDDGYQNQTTTLTASFTTTSSFSPSSMTGILGDYENIASSVLNTGVTPATNGQTVYKWLSQVGGRNVNDQGNGPTFQPTWNTASGGYLSCPGFNFLESINSALTDANGSCWFAVYCRITSLAATQYSIQLEDSVGNLIAGVRVLNTSGAVQGISTDQTTFGLNGAGTTETVTAGTWARLMVRVNGSLGAGSNRMDVWTNGTKSASPNTSLQARNVITTSNGQFIVPTLNTNNGVDLKAAFYGTGVPSDASMTQLDTYMAALP